MRATCSPVISLGAAGPVGPHRKSPQKLSRLQNQAPVRSGSCLPRAVSALQKQCGSVGRNARKRQRESKQCSLKSSQGNSLQKFVPGPLERAVQRLLRKLIPEEFAEYDLRRIFDFDLGVFCRPFWPFVTVLGCPSSQQPAVSLVRHRRYCRLSPGLGASTSIPL